MQQKLLIVFILLLGICSSMRAQELPLPQVDTVKIDMQLEIKQFEPLRFYLPPLAPLFEDERPWQYEAYGFGAASVDSQVPLPVTVALMIAKLFLTSPNALPAGYVHMMNSSFPFIMAKIPGWAPYQNKYSPEIFPQRIATVLDESTGIYRQVPLQWQDDFQGFDMKHHSSTTPIPKIPVTPVERMMP